MRNRLVPHPCIVDKNLGGVSSEQGVPDTPVPPAQCSSARKISLHNFWLQKPEGVLSVEETSEPQAVPLKEPTYGLTYSDSLLLSSSTRVAA